MEKKLVITKDGSHSIAIPEMNVTYHSVHGAIQESMHVFIDAGLAQVAWEFAGKQIDVLEMGFGTGLNALLTAIEAGRQQRPVHYTAIELFPLGADEAKSLNYCERLQQPAAQSLFEELHQCAWEKDIVLTPCFTLYKTNIDLLNYSADRCFNLVYYDAFAPTAQPGLWTKEVFKKLYDMISPGGILVTYCSKGEVRRAMMAAGFSVEKIPGPPGKREMIRATRSHPGIIG